MHFFIISWSVLFIISNNLFARTRNNVLAEAESYKNYSWQCSSNNIINTGNQTLYLGSVAGDEYDDRAGKIDTDDNGIISEAERNAAISRWPFIVSVTPVTGEAYAMGGYSGALKWGADTVVVFEDRIGRTNEKWIAGAREEDVAIPGNPTDIPSGYTGFTGIDCSGFVGNSLDISRFASDEYKLNVTQITTNRCLPIELKNMKKGDVFASGGHVLLLTADIGNDLTHAQVTHSVALEYSSGEHVRKVISETVEISGSGEQINIQETQDNKTTKFWWPHGCYSPFPQFSNISPSTSTAITVATTTIKATIQSGTDLTAVRLYLDGEDKTALLNLSLPSQPVTISYKTPELSPGKHKVLITALNTLELYDSTTFYFQIGASPMVKDVMPYDGKQDTPIHLTPEITFSTAMAAIPLSAVEIAPVASITSVDLDNTKLQINFASDLEYSTTYYITLKADSIKNLANITLDGNGNGISEGSPADDYQWRFITESSLQIVGMEPLYETIGINPIISALVISKTNQTINIDEMKLNGNLINAADITVTSANDIAGMSAVKVKYNSEGINFNLGNKNYVYLKASDGTGQISEKEWWFKVTDRLEINMYGTLKNSVIRPAPYYEYKCEMTDGLYLRWNKVLGAVKYYIVRRTNYSNIVGTTYSEDESLLLAKDWSFYVDCDAGVQPPTSTAELIAFGGLWYSGFHLSAWDYGWYFGVASDGLLLRTNQYEITPIFGDNTWGKTTVYTYRYEEYDDFAENLTFDHYRSWTVKMGW